MTSPTSRPRLRPTPTRSRATLAILGTAVLLSACSQQVTGSPITATGGPPPGTVDIAGLDVGNYPTKPAPLGTAGSPDVGAIVEAQRMANNVTGPWEVDPALTGTYALGGMVLVPKRMPVLQDLAEAVKRHRFVNGFSSSRQSRDETTNLQNAVLRFADPASASAAAADMGRIVAETRLEVHTSPVVSAPIPGHPDAIASSVTYNVGAVGMTTVRSVTPRGPYVLVQVAATSAGLEAATALVTGTLDRQGPLIDQFQATDLAGFAALPLDPTGLLAKTLPVAATDAILTQRTVYQRQGALHFQSDPVLSAKTFADAGMDAMSRANTTVYQARDAAAAQQMTDVFAEEVAAEAEPADAVPGLPTSRCFAVDRSTYCLGTADRYTIEASSTQPADAQQKLAAQYAMLVAG